MPRRPDPDATVVLRRAPARRRGPGLALVLAAILALGGGGLGLLLWQGQLPAPAPTAPAPITPAPEATRHLARLASPLAILANQSETLSIFRIDANPRIVVLDFPSLTQQGLMLNRIAALVEKAGLPRDRVLDDAALAAAIAERGETVESFYFGHNYRAADLVRFFSLAAAQGVSLNAEERRLAAILGDLGIVLRGADGALALAEPAAIVTVPGLQPADPARGVPFAIDTSVREAILRHELSHGEFFTNPAYAAHVAAWWRDRLSPRDRARLRRFLAEGGYDPELEEVMMNEAMAYLVHTPDPRFFSPDSSGIDAETIARLRARFLEGMPDTWLSRVPWPGGR
jgi:hypothetical protein